MDKAYADGYRKGYEDAVRKIIELSKEISEKYENDCLTRDIFDGLTEIHTDYMKKTAEALND